MSLIQPLTVNILDARVTWRTMFRRPGVSIFIYCLFQYVLIHLYSKNLSLQPLSAGGEPSFLLHFIVMLVCFWHFNVQTVKCCQSFEAKHIPKLFLLFFRIVLSLSRRNSVFRGNIKSMSPSCLKMSEEGSKFVLTLMN